MEPASELLILVVAADAALRARCRGLLAGAGFDVALASDSEVGVVLAHARRPAAILVEEGMRFDGLAPGFRVATVGTDVLATVERALSF
jgi:DNA-binding response OmpR family regulator